MMGALLGASRFLHGPRAQGTSALLFHRFLAENEPKQRSIDRLRRELEWLRSSYVPISLSQLASGLVSGFLPDRALVVTTDDAHLDMLEVASEFAQFEVPVSVFVCAGWTARASSGTGEDLLARAVSAIEWYEGEEVELRCGDHTIALADRTKASNIDALLSSHELADEHLKELCHAIDALMNQPQDRCTWADLCDLARDEAVEIGAHSVSHIRLAQASPLRRRFEVTESKRLCDRLIGRCEAFAYPYGTSDAHSAETRADLLEADFSIGFLTHSDFITARSDPLRLPRLTMPDDPMGLHEFQARVCGGGALFRRIKNAMRVNS